ncbi:hypothetical protein AB0C96_15755 [Streptomyces sp. NPDC048506]|uniref:hypothetical protein n=1 Tax=Streptomyces sp. NPDC048506 TaxID=3155028 RepID=UPI0034453234
MSGLITDLKRFDRIGLSRVASHAKACCQMVRHSVFAQLTHFGDTGTALAAVPGLFHWGPVQWPTHWCDLVDHGDLVGDCGVHADVAAALLTQKSVPHVRARAAVLTPPMAPAHWRAVWSEAQVSDAWIGRSVVYHEVLRVGSRWWDPSDARWFAGPGAHTGSGHVLALREEGGQWQLAPDFPAAPGESPAGKEYDDPSEAGAPRSPRSPHAPQPAHTPAPAHTPPSTPVLPQGVLP